MTQVSKRRLEDVIHVTNYVPRPSDLAKMDVCFGVVANTQTRNLPQVEKIVAFILRSMFAGYRPPSGAPTDEFKAWYKEQFGDMFKVNPIKHAGQKLLTSRGLNYFNIDATGDVGQAILHGKYVLFKGHPLMVDSPLPNSMCEIDAWVCEKFCVDLELEKFNPPKEILVPAA